MPSGEWIMREANPFLLPPHESYQGGPRLLNRAHIHPKHEWKQPRMAVHIQVQSLHLKGERDADQMHIVCKVFLSLLVQNRSLTRDNLEERRSVFDNTRVFLLNQNQVLNAGRFPRLYFTFSVNFTVAEGWGCIRFRRVLFGETAKLWSDLKNLCEHVRLSKDEDSCRWLLLTKKEIFSVKSLYTLLKTQQVQCCFKDL
jgi:hypothetical protein